MSIVIIIPSQNERLSEKQFRNMANTGDIILFRGLNFGARVQRTLTGSDFDHVALILK